MLLAFFKERHDPSTRESLSPRHNALLAVLFDFIHESSALQAVRIGGPGGLTAAVNDVLSDAGERLTASEKSVGNILTSMGFRDRYRTNLGWVLVLGLATRDRIHQLLRTHGISGCNGADFESKAKNCDACRALAIGGKS